MQQTAVIELNDVSKIYPLPSGDVLALDHMSICINRGEFVAIMGPSGSGKSTLLNQIGGLDVPTSGVLKITGKNIRKMSDTELTDLRLNAIGYIFQKFNLIPLLTAYENVEYPYILKHRENDTTGRVSRLLADVGIDRKMAKHKPAELSGGQQQRVAIARALVNDPDILLCDEPTGNLDTKTGGQIMDMLKDLHRQGRTIVIVTHDPLIGKQAERIIQIRDGRVAEA
ncbi:MULTISPECIES: ABC transporter ATP-binding protein [unclassified Methanoregula]|uniref:ABC transporter ATP-binding protein n=1 Tax=unclassified Methanoregula TaxID=2649730 RepID=UPI0009D4BF54|nr:MULTISPECIES: ABC transporter ATP-binding protein [unclassified Methanoregula]OPX64414.1 MAG: putative ABC transporter ATP-binding protein [Methanoregula sp. PtaB.Bin085]OPY34916.1 MAG: putative ABC transporter ATP-binding protein [Methanoregula sp. PtaU1.Bin006]